MACTPHRGRRCSLSHGWVSPRLPGLPGRPKQKLEAGTMSTAHGGGERRAAHRLEGGQRHCVRAVVSEEERHRLLLVPEDGSMHEGLVAQWLARRLLHQADHGEPVIVEAGGHCQRLIRPAAHQPHPVVDGHGRVAPTGEGDREDLLLEEAR
eukprot:scaffold2507_cov122-Isochrysis_galbana.AAC.19